MLVAYIAEAVKGGGVKRKRSKALTPEERRQKWLQDNNKKDYG
jgi:hypothetical protein